jgi:hypothetical protein
VAERLLKLYATSNPNFEFRVVEGGHHVHINEPELVPIFINLRFGRKCLGQILILEFRGGSGRIFLGLGWARVEGFGLGLFGLLKFIIGLEAFKSQALITGLKNL